MFNYFEMKVISVTQPQYKGPTTFQNFFHSWFRKSKYSIFTASRQWQISLGGVFAEFYKQNILLQYNETVYNILDQAGFIVCELLILHWWPYKHKMTFAPQ